MKKLLLAIMTVTLLAFACEKKPTADDGSEDMTVEVGTWEYDRQEEVGTWVGNDGSGSKMLKRSVTNTSSDAHYDTLFYSQPDSMELRMWQVDFRDGGFVLELVDSTFNKQTHPKPSRVNWYYETPLLSQEDNVSMGMKPEAERTTFKMFNPFSCDSTYDVSDEKLEFKVDDSMHSDSSWVYSFDTQGIVDAAAVVMGCASG